MTNRLNVLYINRFMVFAARGEMLPRFERAINRWEDQTGSTLVDGPDENDLSHLFFHIKFPYIPYRSFLKI